MCQMQGAERLRGRGAPPASREEVGEAVRHHQPFAPIHAQGAPLPSPTLLGHQPRPRPSLLSSSEGLLQPLSSLPWNRASASFITQFLVQGTPPSDCVSSRAQAQFHIPQTPAA